MCTKKISCYNSKFEFSQKIFVHTVCIWQLSLEPRGKITFTLLNEVVDPIDNETIGSMCMLFSVDVNNQILIAFTE